VTGSVYIYFFLPRCSHTWEFPQFLNLGQSVGLLGRVISSSQGLYLYTNTEKTHTHTQTLNIHALSGIRTYGPGFRASSATVTGKSRSSELKLLCIYACRAYRYHPLGCSIESLSLISFPLWIINLTMFYRLKRYILVSMSEEKYTFCVAYMPCNFVMSTETWCNLQTFSVTCLVSQSMYKIC
jgi:hypothetical protein